MMLGFLVFIVLAPQPSSGQPAGSYQVFGSNDSGMHCIDSDYSIWEILPPGNFLLGQVIQKGAQPQKLTSASVRMTYRAAMDGNMSINTTSVGKTNFWTYVALVFGVNLAPDTGFLGAMMPGAANAPQPMLWPFPLDATQRFYAPGIPITPIDDRGVTNNYPLMQLEALDATTGAQLSSLLVVTPVSTEMHCSDCHATGHDAATPGFRGVAAWSTQTNLDLQTRENVLILHDAVFSTNLFANKPVACSSCHYSTANDLLVHGAVTGQLTPDPALRGVSPIPPQTPPYTLSASMHWRHGSAMGTAGNTVPISDMGIATCYECHPGRNTQCFRGAMFSAGMVCQDCHGNLLSVAGMTATRQTLVLSTTTKQRRRPWVDLPLCQSCHSGDAVNHLGTSIILRQAYDPIVNGNQNLAASPRVATNKRFAEPNNPAGLPMLFKESTGHGGVACESCHGSPHAIWPTVQPNDNLAAMHIQMHSGQIIECASCHGSSVPFTANEGPHGLHTIGQAFVNNHENLFERNRNACKVCHGTMLEGTVISKTQATRVFNVEDRGTVTIAKGTMVSCNLCHESPSVQNPPLTSMLNFLLSGD